MIVGVACFDDQTALESPPRDLVGDRSVGVICTLEHAAALCVKIPFAIFSHDAREPG